MVNLARRIGPTATVVVLACVVLVSTVLIAVDDADAQFVCEGCNWLANATGWGTDCTAAINDCISNAVANKDCGLDMEPCGPTYCSYHVWSCTGSGSSWDASCYIEYQCGSEI